MKLYQKINCNPFVPGSPEASGLEIPPQNLDKQLSGFFVFTNFTSKKYLKNAFNTKIRGQL
ncbi:MAG: hypothetical protein CUR32_08080 [Flavobacterium sp.]|nr:MAG: hypothetical protein CUR32_08080 [Flavobacterium sp.] [Flavobacterium sp. FEMGT703F]